MATRRCTAAVTKRNPLQGLLTCRWNSHDRSSLTHEALRQKVEAGLGQDADGNPLRIDLESKTVSTAAGSLPISPVLDPTWMKKRRRERKGPPEARVGRFRKKLALNPYAHALASPLRMCALTEAFIPRYFLQDFEVVTHPTTGQYWFAPGPAAFENVVPKHRRRDEAALSSSTDSNIHEANESASPPTGASAEELLTEERKKENSATAERRPRRAPVTVYSLSRKPILHIVGQERDEVNRKEWLGIQRLRGVLIRRRKGSAVPPEMQRSVQFRNDMSGLLLKMMRRTTVDGLLARAVLTRDHQPEFIVPVNGWDEVKGVQNRGCVLWLPREDGSSSAAASSAARPYTTMDVDGVGYDRKMAVHNLHWLLGETEVARLRKEAPGVFGAHDILVLKIWTSWSIKSLHLMLWRLQGYLAELDTK